MSLAQRQIVLAQDNFVAEVDTVCIAGVGPQKAIAHLVHAAEFGVCEL